MKENYNGRARYCFGIAVNFLMFNNFVLLS